MSKVITIKTTKEKLKELEIIDKNNNVTPVWEHLILKLRVSDSECFITFKNSEFNWSDSVFEEKEIYCGDCLCRVCANNVCGSGTLCSGCNDCDGIVDKETDCPTNSFVLDEEIDKLALETFKNPSIINPVSIVNLLSAFAQKDKDKFITYANYIVKEYEDTGLPISAKIVKQKIDEINKIPY